MNLVTVFPAELLYFIRCKFTNNMKGRELKKLQKMYI